jgi:hypothetical protein
VIVFINEVKGDGNFEINGNIIYWLFTKYKRVIRSVLAFKIYGLISGFNLGFILTAILRIIY